MDKFDLYRFLAPLRARLQSRLRKDRLNVDCDVFARGIKEGAQWQRIARCLWDRLREESFVADFRPDPEDSLSKVYAMGPEEVRDELIEPIAQCLGINLSGIDFEGFDFSALDTPKAVAHFLMSLGEGGVSCPID